MKDLFNFKLYLEGLKKIKLIGIAAAIVTVGLCALIPIIYMADTPVRDNVYNVEINEFALALVVIMGFVPFFVKSIFSYLNGRRESDFYHSIPYKRQTVYTSFMLAVLTWTLGIITAAVLVCTVLWNVAPGVSFAASTVPLLIASVFTACLMLAGFMAVAMALTGTATSNIFIFGLIACFFRSVCLMVTYALGNVVYILDVSETLLRFTDIKFFFPVALLGATIDGIEPSEVYTNVPMYIYTIVVSIALILLAGWLYVRRKSEMAGKSAPSRRLQHVYRIAFTTPFVLLAFTFISDEIFGQGGMDISFYILMTFVVLAVYFLYELITTKSPKSMLKSAPYLVILLVIGVIFTAGIGIAKNVVLSKTPEADEIESVTISRSGHSTYMPEQLDYETLQTQNIEIKDKAVLKYISDALKFSVESVHNGTFNTRRYYETPDGVYTDGYKETGKEIYKYYTFTTVRIKLENGQTIGRKIKLSEEDMAGMLSAARKTDEYANAYLKIPKPEQIYNIFWNRIEDDEMKKVYETFYDEYTNELSREEQIAYKSRTNNVFGYNIECNGREGLTAYTFDFRIDTSVPKTLNAFAAAMARSETSTVYRDEKEINLNNRQSVGEVLETLIESEGDLSKVTGSQSISYSNLSFSASLYSDKDSFKGSFSYFAGQNTEKGDPDPIEAAEFFYEAMEDGRLRTRYEEGDNVITVDAHFYVETAVHMSYEGKGTVEYISNRENIYGQMLFFCDDETAREFEKYLNDKEEIFMGDVVIKEDYYYEG